MLTNPIVGQRVRAVEGLRELIYFKDNPLLEGKITRVDYFTNTIEVSLIGGEELAIGVIAFEEIKNGNGVKKEKSRTT